MAGKFTHNNDPFTCIACGKVVPPRSVGCRNHCPFCLCSRHVDIYPGDRANGCQGLMRAYGYEMTSKKGLVLLFRCDHCGAETRNVSAYEDDQAPDNYDLILKLKMQLPGSRG